MKPLKLRLTLVILMVSPLFLFSASYAWPFGKDKNEKKVDITYVSHDGWSILASRPVRDIRRYSKFESTRASCPKCIEILVDNGAFKLFDKIYYQGPDKWWSFLLDVPDERFLIVDKNSKLILVGEWKGEELRVPSDEIVFCKGWGNVTANTVFKIQHDLFVNNETDIYLKALPLDPGVNDFEWAKYTDGDGLEKYVIVGYARFSSLPHKMKVKRIEAEGFNLYPLDTRLSARQK